MYEELIRDREELCKENAEVEMLAKCLDWADPADIDKYEKAAKPFNDKREAFRKKYESVFHGFNSALVEKLCAGVEAGKPIKELMRSDGLSLNLETMKLTFKIAVDNDTPTVVGGEIICQDANGILVSRICEDRVQTEPLDAFQSGCRMTAVLNADSPLHVALVAYFQEEWTRFQPRQ